MDWGFNVISDGRGLYRKSEEGRSPRMATFAERPRPSRLTGYGAFLSATIRAVTIGALFTVLLSALLHASWNASIKGSGSPVAFLYWMIALSCVVLGPGLFWVVLSEVTLRIWAWILISGFVHGFYALFLSRAYERGDLSLVYPISRSTPALVPLIAVPFLGERITLAGGAGIGIVVISLWLIQSHSKSFRWRDLLRHDNVFAYCTLLATVAYSFTDASVMRQLDNVQWSGAMPRALFFFLTQAAVQLVFFTFLARNTLKDDLRSTLSRSKGTLLVATLVCVASYWLILEAMRRAPVSYIVAVRQSSVLFAFLIAVIWLKERPTRLRVLGMVGTVVGVALIGVAGG